jgi:predicted MFS family arabinose efflux permease
MKTEHTQPNDLPVSKIRSYITFLTSNRKFTYFWTAGIISQFGNWFNYIAIFVLLEKLTGSGEAVSWFLIAKFIPSSILGPCAGIVADRLSRKAIMIFSDLFRAILVLGFLFIKSPEQVWIVYVLALIQESLFTFANPARQASVPNLCSKDELNIANALSGATWSVLLALGAAAGGFVTSAAGWETAIIIDSLTFVCSAVILFSISIPQASRGQDNDNKTRTTRQFNWRSITGYDDLKDGFLFMTGNRKVSALLLVKSGWALSGGILVMLAVFGEQVFSIAGEGGGSGILYSCRGIGAAIGPIIFWRILGESSNAMMRGIVYSFFVSCAAYLCFSIASNIYWAIPFVLIGHVGGATQWVFSTTLLHRTVEDNYRGRVFAAEMALVTLVLSLSTYFTGLFLGEGYDPRKITVGLALIFLFPAISWCIYLKRRKDIGGER